MTNVEKVKQAVRTNNAQLAGEVADSLRGQGFNYSQVQAFAEEHTGISPDDWEDLMYEADELESCG